MESPFVASNSLFTQIVLSQPDHLHLMNLCTIMDLYSVLSAVVTFEAKARFVLNCSNGNWIQIAVLLTTVIVVPLYTALASAPNLISSTFKYACSRRTNDTQLIKVHSLVQQSSWRNRIKPMPLPFACYKLLSQVCTPQTITQLLSQHQCCSAYVQNWLHAVPLAS